MATCTGIQVNTYDVSNKIVSSDPVTSIVDMGVTSGNKTIEIKGGAIQANMDVRDLGYFDANLEKDEAYKISNLRCEVTKKLYGMSSMGRGPYTLWKSYLNGFPDYMGCLQRVGDLIRFGSHISKSTIRRVIEIENLNGNRIELTIWSDMATSVSGLQINQRSSGSMKQNLGTIPVARYVRRKLMMISRHLCAQITVHRLIKHIGYHFGRHNSLTCFTPETKGLPMQECEQLFRKVESKDPLEIMAELKALDGTKHVFQLHFSPGCKKVALNLFLMMSLIKKTRTSCQSVGTRELLVAPANC
ncbi:hypothetical protein Tco_0287089 [Tanacetum coccineum]